MCIIWEKIYDVVGFSKKLCPRFLKRPLPPTRPDWALDGIFVMSLIGGKWFMFFMGE